MASSLINNAIQVYFDSVLGMEHEGMVAMFESLMLFGLNGFLGCSSAIYEAALGMEHEGMVAMFESLLLFGLSGFLGCSSTIYEAALVEFFNNAFVRDGKVVSIVQGKPVAISEELFAGTFELPLEGLTDLHEVPKDLVFEARNTFSYDGKLLSTSCKKREMTFEFRLLNDILAKPVTVKAGSFDAVTHERFLMMSTIHGGVQICILLKNAPDLELAVEKPAEKKKAVSKKRPATTVEAPVVKRKRTKTGKAAQEAKSLALVTVAQEAVPIQILSLLPVVMHTYKTQQQPDNSGENISQYNSTGYTHTASKPDSISYISINRFLNCYQSPFNGCHIRNPTIGLILSNPHLLIAKINRGDQQKSISSVLPADNNISCKEPDAGCRIPFKNPSAAGYAKITQNDDASTNLDDAVLDMPHRYQLLVNQQASILHNDSKPAVALNQTTSLRLQQPAVAQRKLLLLVSTCKTVLATRHSLVDPFSFARQPPAATISNTTQLPKLVVNTQKR
ncbi:hypothetical protein F511_38011 [Dorcoceras hygrometricum]|uniref:Uncharacterized protein n=1 Tax=Dorcoceras hygrometricum TaxID=472368 RepID=A0A2Z7D3E0_9LAMI|nr:hypothetical protein F511_38011 [Dorcoceras hygrometricum]